MATSVTLPALGESVTEGTVTRWLKQEGDTVEADEPLLEVSTDKVDTEIPSPAAGTLLSIKVQEDETVEVGAELAVIGDSSDEGGGAAPSDGASNGDVSPDTEGDTDRDAAGDTDGDTAGDAVDPTTAEGSAGEQSAEPQPEQAAAEPPSAESGATSDDVSVTLPALGESVTEGTVTRWLKQEGDTVEADEPLLEVSTDKVDTEIPSPAAGTLLSIKVQEDETVEVGAVLAVIGSPGQSSSSSGAPTNDESDVATDEKPAAVAEKALAEQQEEQIQRDSSGGAPSDSSRDAGPAGETSTSTAESSTPAPSRSPATDRDTSSGSSASSTGGAGATDAESSSGPGDSAGDGAYVTPLVRKLAAEAGVDLGSITGSGVGGRIRKQDVLEAATARETAAQAAADAERSAADRSADGAAPASGASDAAAAAPAPPPSASASLRGQTVKMSRMRAFIAKRMVESLQVSAQLTTVVEVDVTQIARLRNQAKVGFQAREGVKLSFLPFFAKASIEALRAYPAVNSSINNETNEVTYHGAEHLGIAVDTERGLIVPVIHDAGDLNIGGLARKIADLAERTRTNKIAPDELSGGTFTLTNTGSRGALFDTPILNQPQVGILGTGAVVKRPVVIDDPRLGETIVVRSMVYLALTYDHRIVDGADAARFLTSMKQRLEEGKFEADLGL